MLFKDLQNKSKKNVPLYSNDIAKIANEESIRCELVNIQKPKFLNEEDKAFNDRHKKKFTLLFKAFKPEGFTILRKKKDEDGNFVFKHDEETNTDFPINERINLGKEVSFFLDVYGKDEKDLNSFKFSYNEDYEFTGKFAPLMLRIAEYVIKGKASNDIYSFELGIDDEFIDKFNKVKPLTLELFTIAREFLIDGKIPQQYFIWDCTIDDETDEKYE